MHSEIGYAARAEFERAARMKQTALSNGPRNRITPRLAIHVRQLRKLRSGTRSANRPKQLKVENTSQEFAGGADARHRDLAQFQRLKHAMVDEGTEAGQHSQDSLRYVSMIRGSSDS